MSRKNITMQEIKDGLMHGGPGSGRYPKGSGERPYQHDENGTTKKKNPEDMTTEELQAANKRDSAINQYKKNHQEKDQVDEIVKESRQQNTAFSSIKNKRDKIEKEKRDNEIDKLDLDDMSEQEMQQYINRKRVENQYRDALKKEADREKAKQGKDVVDKMLEVGDMTVDALVVGYGAYKVFKKVYPLIWALRHDDETDELRL